MREGDDGGGDHGKDGCDVGLEGGGGFEGCDENFYVCYDFCFLWKYGLAMIDEGYGARANETYFCGIDVEVVGLGEGKGGEKCRRKKEGGVHGDKIGARM